MICKGRIAYQLRDQRDTFYFRENDKNYKKIANN